jgi:hypothetical protein
MYFYLISIQIKEKKHKGPKTIKKYKKKLLMLIKH